MGGQTAVVDGRPHEPFEYEDQNGVLWWVVPAVVEGHYRARTAGRPKDYERDTRRTWIGYPIGEVR